MLEWITHIRDVVTKVCVVSRVHPRHRFRRHPRHNYRHYGRRVWSQLVADNFGGMASLDGASEFFPSNNTKVIWTRPLTMEDMERWNLD